MLLPVRFNVTSSPGQTGLILVVAVPATGGAIHPPTVNSHAPISGLVALLGAFNISVVTPSGAPRSFSAAAVGCRLPAARLAYSGFTKTELASWPVAACQFASVAWLAPLNPKLILAAGTKYTSFVLDVIVEAAVAK